MRGLALVAWIAIAAPLRAHDFWIEPSAFHAPVGERLDVRFFVGERFVGEEVARNSERIERFAIVDAQGREQALLGFDGKTPAGIARPTLVGPGMITYAGKPVAIELEAAKFESYLASEGLERVIAERAARGESGKKGREHYARCAKSFFSVEGVGKKEGDAARIFDARVGMVLEIVPERDPCALVAGGELVARVELRSKPLEGALVGVMAKCDPAGEVRVRTDAEGRVRLPVGKAGTTLVRVVWMERAEAGSDFEWSSWWGSMTFEVGARK